MGHLLAVAELILLLLVLTGGEEFVRVVERELVNRGRRTGLNKYLVAA